ncbi:N-glycosylase/DNA lyase OGG1 isoform X1 [Carex littledalei]|uniref:DNA-(apurinic or apyrimidinic site) lyase n=1 Tax=Carex littledalei TaxID=544730 RepID=A0A833REI6_9POAL|nr:N-glycosylase/DNA lyase OGG1 isoform X1 [Carex littledalei]
MATTYQRRRRVKPSTPPLDSTPPPSLSPSLPKQNPNPNPNSSTRRSLASSFQWEPLPFPQSELSLPLTLPTGQSFRWRKTGPVQFTGVVGSHLISLTHVDTSPSRHVAYYLHTDNSASSAHAALSDYFNLGISLSDLWQEFSAVDSRFKELSERFGGGARVMRQDPVECVFQFLCSSNNNIKRIEKMVSVLESHGKHLGSVGGFEFYEFPSIERLALITETELREAGFGYRAKYVVGTAKALQEKPGGGEKWLASLRQMELGTVVDALCTLPGVGPKVAACIALFSLDQHHAVPVDTHVWKIATRYLMPELAGMSLTPKLCNRVAEAFVAKYGKYAGWAQNVLFIGELSSHKVTSAVGGVTPHAAKAVKRKRATEDLAISEDIEGN